jgi:choline dehydrogenase-like flavoprotein
MESIIKSDVVVVGSGIAGALSAYKTAQKNKKVSVLERGPRLSSEVIQKVYDLQSFNNCPHVPLLPVHRLMDGKTSVRSLPTSVGGLANFYAAVSLRLREQEFNKWPFSYSEIEPFYSEAEHLMKVNGESGIDPTEPYRSRPLPKGPEPIGSCGARLKDAAQALGLKPFCHPLAIDFAHGCKRCFVCNQIPCPYGVKFSPGRFLDQQDGLPISIYDQHKAVKIIFHQVGEQLVVDGIEAIRETDGQKILFKGDTYLLAGGAIQTPQLLMNSGLKGLNGLIGGNLMTHSLSLVLGFFPFAINGSRDFEKWISIADFYFDEIGEVRGMIQQNEIMAPAFVLAKTPSWIHFLVKKYYYYACQLLVISEDQPHPENRVEVGEGNQLQIFQKSDSQENKKKDFLVRQAKRILKKAGALITPAFGGLSIYHACGTCRMGEDRANGVTDPKGKVFGTENLYVADASLFPTSGGVNPSLTIAANALRVAHAIQ